MALILFRAVPEYARACNMKHFLWPQTLCVNVFFCFYFVGNIRRSMLDGQHANTGLHHLLPPIAAEKSLLRNLAYGFGWLCYKPRNHSIFIGIKNCAKIAVLRGENICCL